MKQEKPTIEMQRIIIAMDADRIKNKDIAAHFGVKYSTICLWKRKMKNLGVVFRNTIGGRPSLSTR